MQRHAHASVCKCTEMDLDPRTLSRFLWRLIRVYSLCAHLHATLPNEGLSGKVRAPGGLSQLMN